MAKHYTNIRVPVETRKRIKIQAAEKGQSMVDFLNDQFPENPKKEEVMFKANINVKKRKGGELFEFPF